VTVNGPGGNVTVGINGSSNVAVFDPTGLEITGQISATGNITGAYFYGNGSQLTGLSSNNGGNLQIVGRSAIIQVPIYAGALAVVGRNGTIQVPIVA
jgi:hypothetical protein